MKESGITRLSSISIKRFYEDVQALNAAFEHTVCVLVNTCLYCVQTSDKSSSARE